MKYNIRERIAGYIDLFLIFIEVDIFILILFEIGFPFRPIEFNLGFGLGGLLFFELFVRFILHPHLKRYLKSHWRHYIVAGLMLYVSYLFRRLGSDHPYIQIYSRFFLTAMLVLLFIKFVTQTEQLRHIFLSFRVNPAQTIIVSFASIIAIGSFLLYLPYSRPAGADLRYIDALFTSTSAVCVTGLIVVDTGSAFSMIGKGFLLLLIQTGGLGIMTIAAFIQVSLGSPMSLSGRFSTASLLGHGEVKNLFSIIKAIVFITFAFEAVGALLFYAYFVRQLGPGLRACFYSVFHSISAFCNAGFSLYPESFMAARDSVLMNLGLMWLIVSGGLGFTVLIDVIRKATRFNTFRLTVQSRIVFVTTILLLLFGALNFFFLERNHLLRSMRPYEQLLVSLFQSVTARTAGFNTVDTSQLRPITLFMLSTLMFIGASPGSTGGGIKTTTFFILVLSIITILRDQRYNTVFRRRIPYAVVNRAFAILVAAVGFIILGTLLLGYSQNFSFMQLYFETVSAFGTVGLSTGITAQITDFGKIVIMVLMFVGRIGPLTMVLAIKNQQGTRLVTFPQERVMVG
jgi:trk system potassium uptake protein TrkH